MVVVVSKAEFHLSLTQLEADSEIKLRVAVMLAVKKCVVHRHGHKSSAGVSGWE